MQSWIKKHLIRKEHNDAVRRDYSSSLPPPRLSIARDGSGGWFIRHTGVRLTKGARRLYKKSRSRICVSLCTANIN